MNKALIHYFSGTGNSLMAAKELIKEENLKEYEFTLHNIEKGQCSSLDEYSLHIFFFPVYATSVPHIVRKYIRKMEDGKNTKTVIIATNGKINTKIRDGYQGWALHQARLYLTIKHYDVFLSDTLDLPHNITIAFPPRNETANQNIISQGLKPLAKIAQKISEQTISHRRIFILNFLWSIPFGIVYSIIGRRFFGKLFAADSSCNQCQLCVKQCPAKIIKTNGKRIRWGWNCEGCLRCINSCPKRSIQTSTLRVLLMIVALAANPFYFFYSTVKKEWHQLFGNFGIHIFDEIYSILAILLFLFIVDWLIAILSNIRIFRKITGIGHTRLFGRYLVK